MPPLQAVPFAPTIFSESSLPPSPSLSLGYLVGTNRQWGESPRAAPGHPIGDGCLACLPQASCFGRFAPGHVFRGLADPGLGPSLWSVATARWDDRDWPPYGRWTHPPTHARRSDPPACGLISVPFCPTCYHAEAVLTGLVSRRKLGCCLLCGLCACKRTSRGGLPACLLTFGCDAHCCYGALLFEPLTQRVISTETHSGPPGF